MKMSKSRRVMTWNVMEQFGIDCKRVLVTQNPADASVEAYIGTSPDKKLEIKFGEFVDSCGDIEGYGASVFITEDGEGVLDCIYWDLGIDYVLSKVADVTRGDYKISGVS
jgi:hypothetical protein